MSQLFRKTLQTSSLTLGISAVFLTNIALAAQSNPQAKLDNSVNLTKQANKTLTKTNSTVTSTNNFLELADTSISQSSPSQIWEQLNDYTNQDSSFNQITNVNQLRDVSPSDWAYEALRNLVETYGCIAGYPDGTFRGNRAMTRYEFAAGLNACLQQIERLIAASSADFVNKNDLAILQRLMVEFEAELATLGTRVDNLEGRVAFLEDSQFSTTTKLNGNVYTYLLGTFGDDVDADQVTLGSFVHLNFDTSFTGKDRLRTRLQASNMVSPTVAGGTNSLTLTFEGIGSENNVLLDKLLYSFAINDNIAAHIGTTGVLIDEIFDAASTSGLAYDALPRFSAFDSLFYDNTNGLSAAAGLNFDFGSVVLDVGYWVPTFDAQSPQDSDGIFNGNYSAGAQLGFKLFDERFNLALGYLHSYQTGDSNYTLGSFVGTDAATDPFEDRTNAANIYHVSAKFQATPEIAIGGYYGYQDAFTLGGEDADAQISNWNAFVTFSDIFQEGNVLMVSFGQPPMLLDESNAAVDEDEDAPYLLDVEYRFNINDNIQMTPGVYVLFNPNGDADNDTIYVGTLRTIFSF